MKTNKIIYLLCFLGTTGCLKTRSAVKEVEQRQVISSTVGSLQRENADVQSRFLEINEQMRELRGRVEVVENNLKSSESNEAEIRKLNSDQQLETQRRVQLIQDTIIKMDAQLQGLNAELLALRTEKSVVGVTGTTTQQQKDIFVQAKEHFDKKDWRKAILAFQQYREKNPRGKSVSEATYLIGVCFQELGMKDEARAFYDEVIAKFPQSQDARKSRIRLQSLKK